MKWNNARIHAYSVTNKQHRRNMEPSDRFNTEQMVRKLSTPHDDVCVHGVAIKRDKMWGATSQNIHAHETKVDVLV